MRLARVGFFDFIAPVVFGAMMLTGCATREGESGASAVVRLGVDANIGAARAVVVGDVPLVHTAQLLPIDEHGVIVGQGNPTRQIQQVLANLEPVLRGAGSGMEEIVKINVVVCQEEIAATVREYLARRFNKLNQPAVSFVVGNLTHPDALVAMDAVAMARAKAGIVKSAAARILPPGGRYYVSGQAKNGPLAEVARDTLMSLEATLAYSGLGKSNVVQLKAFMQPISESGIVQAEIAKFFGTESPPPTVFVEWHSPSNTPIEIELIAADPRPASQTGDSVEFLTPPGLTVSKVFSRVAHVNHGRMIYLSGLESAGRSDAAGQLEDIFKTLGSTLKESGGDFEHLVKATYYVTDDDASAKLNDIRPRFFNPQRPPAASKAVVTGMGAPGRTVSIDMIAVTK